MTWLKPRLMKDIGVADMAQAARVSERTLHRHLVQHTGLSPLRFLDRMRLERAFALLESNTASIKRVAQQSGFASEYNLRRTFRQVLGISPGEYQGRFCAKAATASPRLTRPIPL